jgi:O-antigen ligase
LGTAAGIGQRFEATTQYTSHNSYLQIGHEAGLPAMVLFVVITIALLRALKRVAGVHSVAAALAMAAFAAGAALAVAGFFQHAWVTPEISWAYWALAGVALNRTAADDEPPFGVPAPDTLPSFARIS